MYAAWRRPWLLLSAALSVTAAADAAHCGQPRAPDSSPWAADGGGGRGTAAKTAAAVVAELQHLCGSLSINDALRAARLSPAAAGTVAQLLVSEPLSIWTVLDMQLLAGDGDEAAELMAKLKDTGVSVGDRGKIKLLFGRPQARFGRAHPVDEDLALPAAGLEDDFEGVLHSHILKQFIAKRALQEPDGVSMDTVAIALSVLVGA
eukprot:SAG31_NODE_14091_length_827_cov_27.082418_1_plen_204_part_01